MQIKLPKSANKNANKQAQKGPKWTLKHVFACQFSYEKIQKAKKAKNTKDICKQAKNKTYLQIKYEDLNQNTKIAAAGAIFLNFQMIKATQ